MRGFNNRKAMAALLYLESTLSGEPRVSRALNTRTWIFWGPAATDGAFLFLFLPHAARRCPCQEGLRVLWE